MPEYQETADDLNRKYHQTWILYDGKPSYIHHFQPSERGIVANLMVPNSKGVATESATEISDVINPNKIDVISVSTSFINNAPLTNSREVIPAIFISRKPKRQWRRGLCSDNTQIKCPVGGLFAIVGRNIPLWAGHIDATLIRNLLTPSYPTLAEACAFVSEKLAIAISPMFCVCISNVSHNKYLLMSTFGFIGECTADHIWVHHQPARQEVQDFVVRTNQSIVVE